jgi:hypothetical protein
MGTLTALIDGLASGAIDVIDLTAPLSADTPIIQLPPEFGQTERFALEEISRYRRRPLLVDAKVVADRPSWWLEEAFCGH